MSGKLYGMTPDRNSVTEFTLSNKTGMLMTIINYGCTITSIMMPDRNGYTDDIVLGFDSLQGYMASPHFIGSIIGRYANRIANGKFEMDGREYSLALNHPPHHLHGGFKGFDKIVWEATEFQNEEGVGVDFYYLSKDGEEGYPGNLHLHVKYLLSHHDEIIFSYEATTDKKTIINLTQHSYFNLNGGKENILDHQLMIDADYFLPVDSSLIPTGEIKRVKGTPFDFRELKMTGRDIHVEDVQLQIVLGYDHNWILNKAEDGPVHAATLYDPGSGRMLEVYTTEPGIQLYTGNFLAHSVSGKNKREYSPYSGLCLETQHFPDSPHHAEFPSVILKAGEQFKSMSVWKFSVK